MKFYVANMYQHLRLLTLLAVLCKFIIGPVDDFNRARGSTSYADGSCLKARRSRRTTMEYHQMPQNKIPEAKAKDAVSATRGVEICGRPSIESPFTFRSHNTSVISACSCRYS